jgi:hypothetical protein
MVYEWQMELSEWECIGEAVGSAPGGESEQPKKVCHIPLPCWIKYVDEFI